MVQWKSLWFSIAGSRYLEIRNEEGARRACYKRQRRHVHPAEKVVRPRLAGNLRQEIFTM